METKEGPALGVLQETMAGLGAGAVMHSPVLCRRGQGSDPLHSGAP